MKHNNICTIGVPEGEERQYRDCTLKNVVEETMTENFPSPVKEKDTVQEAQKFPNTVNPKRPTSRHIIIKMATGKNKERILKAARESYLQGNSHRTVS